MERAVLDRSFFVEAATSTILTYRSRKWTPILTIGAIKTLGRGFSAFAGIGGYFVEQSTKFTIPVEIGFMKRFKSINVMLGATYATPLSSYGGNINPFLGVGYSF